MKNFKHKQTNFQTQPKTFSAAVIGEKKTRANQLRFLTIFSPRHTIEAANDVKKLVYKTTLLLVE